ncbi:MAG: TetR/AcrR family transcriptional regulator [Dehalococcoidia bacterium]
MTTAIRTRARKQAAEVRRETVLDAAVRVFARDPYRSAGTAAIAREAGIAEPTIYRYFSSKRELYLAAVDRISDSICEAWQSIIARTHGGAIETLDVLGEWYFQSMMANPDPLRLRHRAAAEADDDEVRTRIRAGYDRTVTMLAGVIRAGKASGEVAEAVDPEAAAWLFFGIGQVLDLTILNGGDPAAEVWCHKIGEMYERALRPASA